MMRATLLFCAVALVSCAHQLTAACAWGAETIDMAQHCAEQNFGSAGAAFLRRVQQDCHDCDASSVAPIKGVWEFCTLACRREPVPPRMP